MSESHNAASLTAAEAAAMLLWLRDMGADEALAESPVDRFAAAAAAPASPATAAPLPAAPEPRPVPAASPLRNVAPTASEVPVEELQAAARAATSLAGLAGLLDRFNTHPLRATASKLCFCEEAPGAEVLVISDRPRNEEDRSGKVFADKHELLCQRMLAAIGLGAEAGRPVSFLSFLPWRPPGNRPPTDLECRMILPFTQRAVELLAPRLILAFGGLAGQWFAGGAESIQRQRGNWLMAGDVPLLSTFHPEALLKSSALKKLAWHDLLAFRAKLDAL